MATPREHIEHIRRNTFSIGGPKNPLAPMLDKAVMYLSAELYQKDVHFLMELIQNAEDNEYLEGVDPSLEFVITSRDITSTGAPFTLLIFNNEKGFSAKNIESICNVGNSTKKGHRKQGYIGEKGIGFKSVFLITAQPYIFSNGYQVRFNEKPCPHCNLGYVVPEWVEEKPSLSDIRNIYGLASPLPTTTIVLPLKADKVTPVKQQLSTIHPEVLLFLAKIKRLSVREDNVDPSRNTVSAIAITKETNFVTRKNIDALSYTLHLSAEETSNKSDRECSYYLWKQKFPVKKENQTERRMDVEEWTITLAFPNGKRLHRGMHSPGVYAFLPTEMVTNFPFIIQADFVLASSRETILWDEKWNQGILDCVPLAFVNALISLVKTTENAPVSSLAQMFRFLPLDTSAYPKLNVVRDLIKAKLAEENIVPSESHTSQKFFHRPREVGRLMPAFWEILKKARDQGVKLNNLSSHGCYILNSSFDNPEFDQIHKFLGVVNVDNEWYAKCIQGSSLVTGVSEETYLELLVFLADNWCSNFRITKMRHILLLKYADLDGSMSFCSINESSQRSQLVLCMPHAFDSASWLIHWNREFRCVAKHFFLPKVTQEAIRQCSKKDMILNWLGDQAKVTFLSVYDYAVILNNHLNGNRKLVIAYTHFLYHSLSCKHLSEEVIANLCRTMPLVDSYGNVTRTRNGVLVPANGSKWIELIGSNPWKAEGYVELGEDYSRSASFSGKHATGKQLMDFLVSHLGAADVPYVSPPNAEFPTVSAPLTKQNVFLLLDWIEYLRRARINIPQRFLTCISMGSWLKVTMNGSAGYRPPSQSFLLMEAKKDNNWGNILQNGSVLVDIPLIDVSYYGDKIEDYVEELKMIGVMFDYGKACEFIGNRLMSLSASSALSRSNVISVLNFIRLLRQKFLPPDQFICSIKEGRWLRTSHGDRSPVGSVLHTKQWTTASLISNIPFIDQHYYGNEIQSFAEELQLLGVVVDLRGNYKLVLDHLKSSSSLTNLPPEALLLVLDCIFMNPGYANKVVNALKHTTCLKTNVGYKSPGDCFLSDPVCEWGCLFEVFGGFPLLDVDFYGSRILNHKEVLKLLGVKVDVEEGINVFVETFKQKAKSFSITKENVVAFLSCYRRLRESTKGNLPTNLKKCIREVKWLRTRLGDYRSPRECILFGPSWESIAPITLLPFIDDSDKCYGNGIHEYRKELQSIGVTIELGAGVQFVPSCFYFPRNLSKITSATVLSLLKCVKMLLAKGHSFLDSFHPKQASHAWLKTHFGYRTPDKCCLFDSEWAVHLKQTDGPFIDEEFYGSNITSYKKELEILGVTVDVKKGCPMLAGYLDSHSEFSTIVRIYRFLEKSKWKPKKEEACRIWIPEAGSESGKWVNPEECVLCDKDGLFDLQLIVLEKYYDPDLLGFFSVALGVKSSPSLDDYLELWKAWESSGKTLSETECCAFWVSIMKRRNSKTEKRVADEVMKLPVALCSGEILLVDKSDAFIADDLQLKDLFQKISPHPMFVWYPKLSLPSLPRTKLTELFHSIGVRTISDSVQKEELFIADSSELKLLNRRDCLIGEGLVRLILAFLADPSLNMEAKMRQDALQGLLNLTVVETVEPITVNYSLSLSSGEIVEAPSSQMILWDKDSAKLFMQKMDGTGGKRTCIEYATCFSDVIAEGVLWENEDHIWALSDLIKLAFLLDFDEEAVQFLMKARNLQTFMEDEEFLSAAFSSE